MKHVLVDSGSHQYRDTTEINRNLTLIIDELNQITEPHALSEVELKEKILADLRHLELVVTSKIKDIELDVARLK